MMRGKRLVLASASTRRRELVAALDAPAEAIAPEGAEAERYPGESPDEYVTRLALAKAREVAQLAGPSLVIGADTAVVLEGETLGKPASGEQAVEMLRRLRGRVHLVVTGVAVLDSETGLWLASPATTEVEMRRYSDREIERYVASGEPFDKAGAYAIQDQGFRPVKRTRGCYLNVVGLPLCEVEYLLAGLGSGIGIRPGWRHPHMCVECRRAKLRGIGTR